MSIRAAQALAHVLQDFASLLFRQVYVKNHDVRTRVTGITVSVIEKLDCLLSILSKVERERQPDFFQRPADQKRVSFVVFHYKHLTLGAAIQRLREGR